MLIDTPSTGDEMLYISGIVISKLPFQFPNVDIAYLILFSQNKISVCTK